MGLGNSHITSLYLIMPAKTLSPNPVMFWGPGGQGFRMWIWEQSSAYDSEARLL